MNLRTALLAAGLFATSAYVADILTDIAPPPPKIERAPPAREGYVWGPGHWEWSGHAYYWTSGVWVVEHRGAHFVADQWEKSGTQWRFLKGHWDH